MTFTITVTSKNQITIPARIAKLLKIHPGDKLSLMSSGESIQIQKAKSLLDALSGSVTLPIKYKDEPIEFIIRDAKREFFEKRR